MHDRLGRTFAADMWRSYFAGRVGDVVLALWLVLLGWKMTHGLGNVIDIDLADETYYLKWGLGFLTERTPPEWSPLYAFAYWLLDNFVTDPTALYVLNQKFQTILLPVALFACLRSLRVGRLAALILCSYYLISGADLQISPKPMHFALSVLLIFLSLFFRLRDREIRVPILTLGVGMASLIRPEFFVSTILLTIVQAFEAIRYGSFARRILYAAASLIPIGILYYHFGVPIDGGRSYQAFTQHFMANYARWHGISGDLFPLAQSIFRSQFGASQTVLDAAVFNPGAFLHHMITNIVRFPRSISVITLLHYNLITPRTRDFAIFEALLLGAAALAYLLQSRGPISLDAGKIHSIEMACLGCLIFPALVAVVAISPRAHYVMAIQVFVVLTICFALRLDQEPRPAPFPRLAIPALLLLAAVPSVGSLGATIHGATPDLVAAPRPVLKTIGYLRSLHTRTPLVICESFTGAIDAYLGKRARSISIIDYNQMPIDEILAKERVNVFVVDPQFNDPHVAHSIPGLAAFLDDPTGRGFHRVVLDDVDVVVLVSDSLKSDDTRRNIGS